MAKRRAGGRDVLRMVVAQMACIASIQPCWACFRVKNAGILATKLAPVCQKVLSGADWSTSYPYVWNLLCVVAAHGGPPAVALLGDKLGYVMLSGPRLLRSMSAEEHVC